MVLNLIGKHNNFDFKNKKKGDIYKYAPISFQKVCQDYNFIFTLLLSIFIITITPGASPVESIAVPLAAVVEVSSHPAAS